MVYSPLDALRIARENPDREVVFFAVGFETTAPSTALTLMRAKAEGVANFFVFCNHVTIVPPLRALLESPDLRLDGFIGARPRRRPSSARGRSSSSPPTTASRSSISGFEPLDLLQSVHMLLRQLAEGRCEVENQYTRVVPYDGNPRALRVLAEVFELRPHFEWRGLGFISHSALKLSDAYAGLRRRAALRSPGRARRRPEGLPVRRGAEGRDQALGVQGLRHGLHARAADRDLHGLVGGRVRRVLQLRPLRPREREVGLMVDRGARAARARPDRAGPLEAARASATSRSRWRTAPAARRRQTLIEGLLAPAFGSTRCRARRRRRVVGRARADHRQLRRQADPLSRAARSASWPSTARSTTSRSRGARPLALTLSLVLEEGLAADDLRAEVEAIAAAAERRGRRGRRRRHEGRRARPLRLDVRDDDRARPASTTGRGSRRRRCAGRPHPRLRPDRRARDGDHARPRRVRARRRGRVRHALALAGGRRAARRRRARRCAACATRPAAASRRCSNELARASGVADASCARRDVPVPPAVAGACEILGHRPDVRGERGHARRLRRAGGRRRRRSRALRSVPGCEEAAEIGEVRTDPPGLVLVETAFGGRRVMDLLVGDPLPRIC